MQSTSHNTTAETLNGYFLSVDENTQTSLINDYFDLEVFSQRDQHHNGNTNIETRTIENCKTTGSFGFCQNFQSVRVLLKERLKCWTQWIP
ncbi:hypothetical protein WA026_020204 [Henosepilachna vigintioctopunctata]|uniref:Uncharacterized protein n=1 Tax=Henosepilachna vigintioctopunctata TaxID=420089 RepID=A0AAW1U643_9CUCU